MARAPHPQRAEQQPSKGIQEARSQHRDILDRIRVREFSGLGRGKGNEKFEEDVLKIKRNRVVDEIAEKRRRDRGRPSKRSSDLQLPAAKNVRPRTVDGRTSFHFSHEAVSKTRNNMEKDSGLKVGPGAARKHGRYIERDGAIAKMTDKDEAELNKLLDEDLTLEAGESKDGLLTVERRKEAALHGYYVERQEALATQPDGEKVLFTNISGDATERAQLWDKIEEFERNPSPDELTINVGKHQAFWDKVSKEPDFPKALSEALLIADPDKAYRFQTDDARSTLRWLREQPEWDKENPQVQSKLGEGGRIQYRIIGELPHELDLKGRTAILAEFANEFEKRKLPYVAVMHAPDHTNDDRNWHFHLIYYDRPVEKMADGRWDFEVEQTFTRPNRMTRTNFPHRQEKLKEVNEKTWIPKLRKRLAEITNDHLQMSSIDRRVDPRRYSEMGIHREAQEHLGTRAAALESMGVATPTGYRNANKEWDAVFADVENRRERERKKTDQRAQQYHGRIDRNYRTDPNQNAALHARVERWRQTRDEAAEFTSYATSVHKNYERLISRSEKVHKTCQKQLDAVMKLNLPRGKKMETLHLSKRQKEAIREIQVATEFMSPMLDKARRWARNADALNAKAKLEEAEIDRILATRAEDTDAKAKDLKQRRQRDDGTFQGQDGEYRRALNKTEMDAWVEAILKGRRRLVRKDRRIVPMTPMPGDEKTLEAGNYGAMTARLSKIKESQDALVAQVVSYVEKNPHAVQRERNAQGEVTLSLRVSRPQWKSAFTDYAEDPDIKRATTEALEVRDGKRQARPAEASITQPATTANQQSNQRPGEQVAREPATAEPTGGADGVLAKISRQAIRLRDVDGAIVADAKALAAIGVAPAELEPAFVQNRLRGVHREQQRDFARLSSFVQKHPYSIVENNGTFKLGPKSPGEVAAIAEKWVGDEEVQKQLRTVREALRGPSKVRQEKPAARVDAPAASAEPTPTKTRSDEYVRTPVAPDRDRTPDVRDVPQVAQPVVPAREDPKTVQPKPVQEEPRMVEPRIENAVEPRSTSTVELQQPTERPVATDRQVPSEKVQENRPEVTPERSDHKDDVVPAPKADEPAPKADEPAPKADEPAAPQPGLFDDQPQTVRTGREAFERQQAAVAPLRERNAAVDEWLKAGEQDRNIADRRRLASEIGRDRQAMADLVVADPELARQLQADIKAFQRTQNPGRGLGRGLRPRR